MAAYGSLSESQLSPLQPGQRSHQVLSKLELLKNEYQERALLEKEQKMLKLLKNGHQESALLEKEQKMMKLLKNDYQERALQEKEQKLLKNDYQERALQEKEQKMLKLLTQQRQVCISRRINGYRALQPPEENTWASNWTVAKKTAGVDRAHPLKPLHSYNESTVHRFPSANIAGVKHPLPYVRSKSGPSCTERWQELEKSEMDLEAKIRRKEALLHKKLRRTEEELRRIQREKEECEQEESRAQEISDVQTRPRRTRLKTGNFGDSVKAGKDKPLSIDQYRRGSVKAGEDKPLSIEKCSVKARSDSPLSSSQCSGGGVQDSLLSIGDQHYRGHRGMAGSLTQIVDSIQQLKLEASQVQDSGHPSSEDLEEALLDSNVPQSPGQQLVPCQLCGRCFMEHRLQKHTAVCEKTHSSRRKVFDSSKARAKGTDLEQYLHKKGRQSEAAPQQVKPNSWSQKHEFFLRSIRQSRVVQPVVARGGRISDLLPASPEENPGYVACPYCSRRFDPRAAERHIPKCKTIKSRPRPPPARRR